MKNSVSADRRNNTALKVHTAKRINAIGSYLDLLPQELPPEIAIEMQHALAHMAIAGDCPSLDAQSSQWRQALAHWDRALLDLCKKIVLFEFPKRRNEPKFLQYWLQARQKEYQEHTKNRTAPLLDTPPEPVNNAVEFYQNKLLPTVQIRTILQEKCFANDIWKNYSIELEDWLRSDLILGGLSGKKSIANLCQLVLSLWELDIKRLHLANIQIHLDAVMIAKDLDTTYAAHIEEILKVNHSVITKYKNIISQKRQFIDLQKEETWITSAFLRLLQYYEIAAWRALRPVNQQFQTTQ